MEDIIAKKTRKNAHSLKIHELDDLNSINNFIDMMVAKFSIPFEIGCIIHVVVDEICVNYCNYGQITQQSDCFQEISFYMENNLVLIEFKDNGIPFNPLKYP